MVRIQAEPIHPESVADSVRSDGDGAVVLFAGTVRRDGDGPRAIVRLVYDAYQPMALSEMESIEARAREHFEVSEIAIVHRVGPVELGEASVAIAVAAPHRAPALDACRFVIDELKSSVPIWKQNVFADGTTSWLDD